MADRRIDEPMLMTVGDRRPALVHTFKDDDASAISLATDTDYVLFRLVNSVTGVVVVNDVTATITDGPAGQVTYNWGANDTTVAGYYDYQWQINYSDGCIQHIAQPQRLYIRGEDGHVNNSWLMTFSQAKLWLGDHKVDHDHRLRLLIPAVTKHIQQHVGCDLIDSTYTHNGTTLKKLDGTGNPWMYTQHHPVTNVSALSLYQETDPDLTDVEKFVYYDDGRLQFTNGRLFTKGFQNVSLTYRAGYTIYNGTLAEYSPTMPYPILDVARSVLQRSLFEWETKGPAIASMRVSDQDIAFTVTRDAFTEKELQYLEPFRRYTFG